MTVDFLYMCSKSNFTAYIKRSYHWYCMPDYVVAIAMIVTMRWLQLDERDS